VSLSAQATLLAQLQAQLQILLKQAGEHGIAAISPGGGSGTSGLGGGFVFLKNLSFPVRDPDVLHVQQFLNGHGFVISPSGPGSPGHETIVFGYATLYQLKRYQASVGIPATGYFGFQTRAFMNTRLR
jgi:peptidoglycan hydrolase-like protein with peptidoglycan-binding domain